MGKPSALRQLAIFHFQKGKSATDIFGILGYQVSVATIYRWISDFKNLNKTTSSGKAINCLKQMIGYTNKMAHQHMPQTWHKTGVKITSSIICQKKTGHQTHQIKIRSIFIIGTRLLQKLNSEGTFFGAIL